MLRMQQEYETQIIPNMKGGQGSFCLEHILRAEEFCGKGRLFARAVLQPGCSVGMHRHSGDMEVCYFLSGMGIVVQENGLRIEVRPGDANIVMDGESHEIRNEGEEDLIYIALILYT